MNFYKHHLGDYDSHTSHLSWDEDMAYTRLIRAYYRREKPFTDKAEAYRLCRAVGKTQRGAVDTVLAEFFNEHADGWHSKRCDEEIAKAIEEGEDNAARKENEKERQQRHRMRRKELFEALRGHGQVPAWDTPTESLQSMLNTCMSRKQERDGDAPVTRDATANHQPLATSHKPTTPETESSQVGTAHGRWAAALIAKGVKATSLHPTLRAWVDGNKFTLPQVLEAVAVARLNKPEPESIPLNYLDKILRNPPRDTKSGGNAWWANPDTMMAKAREFGVSTIGLMPDELKRRIQEAIAKVPRETDSIEEGNRRAAEAFGAGGE